jgi:metallophosphoesterase (TIGR00282 family)
MIGDIVGKPGRKAAGEVVPTLRREHGIDLVVANGENAAGGFGLTLSTAKELLSAEIDVITTGNHIWAQKEIIPYLDSELPILRPLNFPPRNPGRGYLIKNRVVVVNIIGRVFMGNFDCPFRAMDELLEKVVSTRATIVVDFHAEATSEKVAMGRYLAGRVSAVFGTHTHVGTIDAQILPGGTAYVTDVGMVGPVDSVIGDDAEAVIDRFLTQAPRRLSVGKGKVNFDGVLVEVDDSTGKAMSITRIHRIVG